MRQRKKQELENKSLEELEKQKLIEDILRQKKDRFLTTYLPSIIALITIGFGYLQTQSSLQATNEFNCISMLKDYETINQKELVSYTEIVYHKLIDGCFDKADINPPLISTDRLLENKSKNEHTIKDINAALKKTTATAVSETPIDTAISSQPKNIIEEKNSVLTLAPAQQKIAQKVDSSMMVLDLSITQKAQIDERLRKRTIVPSVSTIHWVKRGYYVDTKVENLLVSLQQLDVKEEKAIIKVYTDKASNTPFEKTFTLYLTEKPSENKFAQVRFPFNDAEYRIHFDAINFAGKNPFTKAMYFTFQQYQNKP